MLINGINRGIVIISDIVIGCLSIAVLVISIIGYTSLHFSNRAISDIIHNWDKLPILDIIDSKNGCTNDYITLVLDQWAGTVSGCNCVGRWSYRIPIENRNKLNKNTCSWNMTLAGCTDVASLPPKDINKWRGTTFCVKKATKAFKDYINDSVPANKDCKNGMKQCGVLDTVNNKICISDQEQCPINQIYININKDSPTDHVYKKIPLLNGFNLYFTNEAIDKPIHVDLKLSEGQACLDPEQRNTQFNQYILDREYSNYDCTENIKGINLDNRYTKIDSYLKRDLYIDNGVYSYLFQLPYYPYGALEALVDFYNRPFIGWKNSCLNDEKFSPEGVNKVAKDLDDLDTKKLVVMIFAIIIMTYLIVKVVFKHIYFNNVALVNLLEGIFVILSFVIFIIAILCYKVASEYSNEWDNFNCGDDLTNLVFEDLGKKYYSNKNYDMSILIMSLFCVIIYPAMLLIIVIIKMVQWRARVPTAPSGSNSFIERGNSLEEAPTPL
jgi:hypothetical protein